MLINLKKGYGFIKVTNRTKDVYFRLSNVNEEDRSGLRRGTYVEFSQDEGDNGPIGYAIEIVSREKDEMPFGRVSPATQASKSPPRSQESREKKLQRHNSSVGTKELNASDLGELDLRAIADWIREFVSKNPGCRLTQVIQRLVKESNHMAREIYSHIGVQNATEFIATISGVTTAGDGPHRTVELVPIIGPLE